MRIEVDGLGDDWWIHAADLETLEDDFKGRTTLLSPFDNLLCDRARTEQLFGFTHRLEIYVPKPKRRWGYFVLPVLDGDRLVARIDLAMDRERDMLVAHAVHAERAGPARQAAPGRDPQRARAPRRLAWRDGRRGPPRARRVAPRARFIAVPSAPEEALAGQTEGVSTTWMVDASPL